MTAELIVFNGVKYRRYPDSKNWAERSYYTPGIADRQKGRRRLHEELWTDAHGPIPAGCEIHHQDHNPLNNQISNLICVTSEEHAEHHAANPRPRTPDELAHLDRIRPLAAEWHRSPDGRAWHQQHGAATWVGRAYAEYTCNRCSATFLSRATQGHQRFCSNACKSAARRAAGTDDVDGVCACCGVTFQTNRYRPRESCSKSCSAKLQHQRRRAENGVPSRT